MTAEPARPQPAVRLDDPPSGVAVVICAYTLQRWADIEAAVHGLTAQTRPADEVVLVVDHNPELAERAASLTSVCPGLRVVESSGAPGLSGARNTGVAATTSAIVAFLDDDARPEPTWLEELVAPFGQPGVVGTAGRVRPAWPSRRPSWFPPEFDWVVGASYTGLPTAPADVRNPIGASMAMRRDAMAAGGGFREGIGRVGTLPLGCEETELAIRIRQVLPGARICYVPTSVVDHRVSPDRMRFRYFRRRCMAEGTSKAAIGAVVGSTDALESETAYVRSVLPSAVTRGIRAGVRGEMSGFARAAAVTAGLGFTTVGYGAELARRNLRARVRP